jgi:hypothetical protein
VIEQKIHEVFGDAESTGIGTGWWSGVLSVFCGFLSFGAVLCLHFPQLLTVPQFRSHYPMHSIRTLIQGLIVGAGAFGILSSILRKKKVLALTGLLLALTAAALGGVLQVKAISQHYEQRMGVQSLPFLSQRGYSGSMLSAWRRKTENPICGSQA